MKFIKRNYNYLIFSFFFVSIMCWGLEVGYSLIIRNKLAFPGIWRGPYCPIYGLTFIFAFLVVNKKDNILLNLLKIGLIVTTIEYITAFISDEMFNNVIWDYSDKFLNLNGRICLEMSLLFTVLGMFVIYILEPILRRIYIKIEEYIKIINIILIVIFTSDTAINVIFSAFR